MFRLFLIPLLGLLALSTVAITACQPTVRQFNSSATIIDVKKGERFTIELDGNRTTGYSWQLAQPLDTNVATLVSTTYSGPTTGSGTGPQAGAGGRETLTFTTNNAGTAELVLEYVRPWEKGVPPTRTATFNLTVQP